MSEQKSFLPLRLRAWMRHPKVRAFWIPIFWGAVLFYFGFGALILTTRWYLLPNVDRFTPEIETLLEKALKTDVSIGGIHPSWNGFWPHLTLTNVHLTRHDETNPSNADLVLPQVQASIAWSSVLGTPYFRSLSVSGAQLHIERIGETSYRIAGFPIELSRTKDPVTTENDFDFLEWLLDQGRIDIIHSQITYEDLVSEQAKRLAFDQINFTLTHETTGHQLGLQGKVRTLESEESFDIPLSVITPNPHSDNIDLRARIGVNFFDRANWHQWNGQLYVRANEINVAELLRSIPTMGSTILAGHGSLQGWLDFNQGEITHIESQVRLTNASIRFNPEREPLNVRKASLDLSQWVDDSRLYVDGRNLNFTLPSGDVLPPVHILFSQTRPNTEKTAPAEFTFAINEVDLSVFNKLKAQAVIPEPVLTTLQGREPTGVLRNIEVKWSGSLIKPNTWSITAMADNLALNLPADDPIHNTLPNFSGLSGNFLIAHDGITAHLDSQNTQFQTPNIFDNNVFSLDSLKGTVKFQFAQTINGQKQPAILTIEALDVANHDLQAQVSGTWTQDDHFGNIDLTGAIQRAQADRVYRYFPRIIPTSVRQWLEGGLVTGTAHDGKFILKGPLHLFPWADNTSGHFLVDTPVRNATVDYMPTPRKADGSFDRGHLWPLLTDINGRFVLEGTRIDVYANQAQTLGAPVTSAHVAIPNYVGDHKTPVFLDIRGKARAELAQLFNYVEKSPVSAWLSHQLDGTQAQGMASLDLSILLPLAQPQKAKVAIDLDFENNRVQLPIDMVPELSQVQGRLHIHESGASADKITAMALDRNPVSARVETKTPHAVDIHIAGTVNAEDASKLAPYAVLVPYLRELKGQTPFTTDVAIRPENQTTITAKSDLQGIGITLPSPFRKTAEASLPFALSIDRIAFNNKTRRITSAKQAKNKANTYRTQVRLGNLLHFEALTGDALKTAAMRLSIAQGKAELPTTGMNIAIDTPTLSVSDWVPLVRESLHLAQNKTASNTKTAALRTESIVLNKLTIRTDRLSLHNKEQNPLVFSLSHPTSTQWLANIQSPYIFGHATFDDRQFGQLNIELDRLHLSSDQLEAIRSLSSQINKQSALIAPESVRTTLYPQDIPNLQITVNSLKIDERDFGRLNFDATRRSKKGSDTLQINKLNLDWPEASFRSYGLWQRDQNANKASAGQSQLVAELQLSNGGRWLEALRIPGVMQNGRGSISATLNFNGAPWALDVHSLDGSLSANLAKGSLVQMDTGLVGGLLSVVSIQSLLKRLTLDFDDLVQKGFSFDAISASATIALGQVVFDNSKIVGSHGTILAAGTIDLPKRQLNTDVTVLPDLNAGNASLALSFLNPAVGISTFIAQMILRDPLKQLFRVDYRVSGPFDAPIVERIKRENSLVLTDSTEKH